MTKQKYLGQRINGWWLSFAILFWVNFFTYIDSDSDFWLSFLRILCAVIFTKLSFEDIKK